VCLSGGNAVLDNCGICGGDNSDCTDCLGEVGGTAIVDCAGVCDGSAVEDNCGTCDSNSSNDCTQDCAGIWGGTHVDSDCGTVTDIDGNEYKTIKIGDQNWMAENLKTTHYNDGSDIPTGYSNSEWTQLQTGAYAVYDDDASNADIYGNLYNWYVVDDSRGLCMDGWHVPSDEEFKELEMVLGLSEEEADNEGWRGTIEARCSKVTVIL
jgi:hypothetical protein